MLYCLIFLENNAKKITAGLMCSDFVKPFCTQDSYVISSGKEIFPASFPLFSNKTVLDNVASTNCSDAEFEADRDGNERGRRDHLS